MSALVRLGAFGVILVWNTLAPSRVEPESALLECSFRYAMAGETLIVQNG